MVKKKDDFGSIGLPGRTSQEHRTKIGAYELRGRTPFYNFMYRFAIIIVIASFILVLVGGINGVNRLNKLTDENSIQLRDGFNPSFKVKYDALGARIVEQWYTGGEPVSGVAEFITWPQTIKSEQVELAANLPKIEDITFIGGERFDMVFDRNNSLTGHNETLRYLVRFNGVLYTTTITLQINDTATTNLPDLVAVPTLTPYTIIDPPVGIDNRPSGMDPATDRVKTGIQSQVDLWTKAWTTDDRAQLKQITQDGDTDSIYRGLGGWSVPKDTASNIRWAYVANIDGDSYVVAQVEFVIQSFGPVPEDPEQSQMSWKNTQMMDILIKDYNTGLPAIVGWGSAGSWSTLDKYINATNPKAKDEVIPESTPLPTEIESTVIPSPEDSKDKTAEEPVKESPAKEPVNEAPAEKPAE